MSTISPKEKNMLMVIVVLVLYSIAALCYRKQKQEWKKHERIYDNALKKYAEECDLIKAKDEWNRKYTTMCSLMPIFPYDKDVDTHWLNLMDTVASENDLVISRRQTGNEEEVGDVFELPLECKNWEGTLKSLVGFLYGLRNEGAMLDVRQIYVKPASKPGYLRGTFSLYCAYMRGEVVEEESSGDRIPGAVPQVKLRNGKQASEVNGGAKSTRGTPPVSMDDAASAKPRKALSPATVSELSKPRKRALRTETGKKAGNVDKSLSANEEAVAVEATLETLKKKAE